MRKFINRINSKVDRLLEWELIALFIVIPFSKAFIEVLLALIIFTWMVKRYRKRDFHAPKSPLFICFILFWVSALLSLINTPSLFESIGELVNLTEYLCVSFIVSETISTERILMRLFVALLMVSAILVIDGCIQLVLGYDVILGRKVGIVNQSWRMTATFKHPNSFGAYLAAVLPMLVSLLYVKNVFKCGRWIKFAIFILILSLGMCLLLTYSRGALVGLIAGLLFFSLFKDKRLFAVMLIIILIAPFMMSQPILERVKGIVNLQDLTLQMRFETWKFAMQMFLEHPVIGNGLKSFSVMSGEGYAHNCYLQLLAEMGLVGALTLIVLLGRFFQVILAEFSTVRLGVASGVFAMCVHSVIDNHFYALVLATLLWFMMGLAVSEVKEEVKSLSDL